MTSSTISSTTDRDTRDSRAEDWDTAAAAVPALWTPDHVARRLVDAFRTLDRMPRPKGPRAAGNHWPAHRLEWADRVSQAELPEAERRARDARRNALACRPDGTEIARMDVALDWLRALRAHNGELAMVISFWALQAARRRSVRAICREFGWKPSTFYYQRNLALVFLAEALNKKGTAVC
jgi:hypothetical protein